MLIGKSIAHLLIYVFPAIFALHIIPLIFKFPMNGDVYDIILMLIPFLLASSFFGQIFRVFVNNREGVFLLLGFTSLIFMFLAGVSWPHYQMPAHWQTVSGIVPGYWASTAYVYMHVLGSSLSQVSHLYLALWVLTAVLFVIAYAIERFVLRPRYEAMRLESELDPDIVREQTLYQMGDDDLPDAEWIGDSDE